MAEESGGTDWRDQLLVLFVVFGALLLLFGIVYNPEPQYTFAVSDVENETAGALESVAYEELSAEGQDGFRAALEDPDGTATVFGTDRRPSDLLDTGADAYLVEYEGDEYRLEVSAREGFIRTSTFDPFVMIGGIMLGFAGLRLYRRRKK